jgi:AraC family transcriptional activator of pobA
MTDMGLPASVPGFALRRLEDGFQRARQDVRQAHRHDYFLMGLVIAGRGRLTADFGDYAIRPPMLFQFGPGVVHGWRPTELPRGYMMNFERTFLGEDARDQAEVTEAPAFCLHSGPRVLPLNAGQRSIFEPLARAMQREHESRGKEHAAALRSYLRIWLIEANRIAESQRPERWNDRGTELVNRFLCLVGDNFRTLSAVSEYAARLRVTSSHLNETVRRTMQKTAGQVIRGRLLLEAKRLLRHSDLSVSEVAYHLKFEDPSYFARFFRKLTGQPPAEFRARAEKPSH